MLALPSDVDLRPDMPPVYDQGQLGACTGNGIAAAVDYSRKVDGMSLLTPSRLFIYYNERAIEGTVSEDAGAEIRDGITTLTKWGVCSEAEWPYQPAHFRSKPAAQCYADAKKNVIESYQRVPQTKDSFQAALFNKRPVIIGFTCYESLENDAVERTGDVPLPGDNEKAIGGHCVLASGYRADGKIRFRNSWGTTWGDGGYGTLPWDYVLDPNLASDFWFIEVQQEQTT
jgi:C1A family cysteine protease